MLKENPGKRKLSYIRGSFDVYKGLALTVLASSLLSVCAVIVKSVHYMSASELAFIRYVSLFVFDLPFLIYRSENDFFNRKYFCTLLARGFFGSASFYLSFLSLKLMPIAESSVIVSSSPVWVTLLSRLFLKEKIGLLSSLSLLSCMVGLVLMSKVFHLTSVVQQEQNYQDLNYWYGCAAALSSAVLAALTFVLIRGLKNINESVTVGYQSLVGILGTAVLVSGSNEINIPKCGVDGTKMVLLGALSFSGQLLLTKAIRLEKAGIVSTVRFSCRVVLLFILQFIFFKEIPDVSSVLATVCVTVSLYLAALRKFLERKDL